MRLFSRNFSRERKEANLVKSAVTSLFSRDVSDERREVDLVLSVVTTTHRRTRRFSRDVSSKCRPVIKDKPKAKRRETKKNQNAKKQLARGI